MSSKGAHKKGAKKSEGLWILSFADMTLLLLCFFIALTSTMKPDRDKYKTVENGMKNETRDEKKTLKSVGADLKRLLKDKNIEKNVKLVESEDKLYLEFKEGLVFEQGSADISLQKVGALQPIFKALANIDQDYQIHIDGHTDDIPLQNSKKFESNWELSAARGFALMRQLNHLGVAEKQISVTAFAHTRPIVNPQGLEGSNLQKARASNRRVVVWLE